MDSTCTTSFKILMFPWLAHGHIFPFLELSKRILRRKNFHIYICSTQVNSTSINTFIQSNSLQSSIEFVELHLQPTPELPPDYHTTNNLPPNLNFTLIKAFQTADSSFSDIISNLKPDLLIYDAFQPWSAKQALSRGIPAVLFRVLGAASFSCAHNQYVDGKDPNYPFPRLILSGPEMKSIDELLEFLSEHVFIGEKSFSMNSRLSYNIVLVKTSRGFEGKYIRYCSDLSSKKVVSVGPLVSDDNTNDERDSEIMVWLDGQKLHSTVYISFGSEHFLSKEEMCEIAEGLEICGVSFIWVIRFPIGEKIDSREALPEGFLERVKGRGIIVEGWAPQSNILAHQSISGFMSHFGWSSINESLYFGVPIICMPFRIIMFVDSRMLVEEGVGVEVVRDENLTYKGEEIAKAIRKVVLEEKGEAIRRKAREVRDKIRMEEDQELDVAAEELWQLCLKKLNNVLNLYFDQSHDVNRKVVHENVGFQ